MINGVSVDQRYSKVRWLPTSSLSGKSWSLLPIPSYSTKIIIDFKYSLFRRSFGRARILVGARYDGQSTSDPVSSSGRSFSRSRVTSNANVYHRFNLSDPINKFPGDLSILSAAIYMADGALQFKFILRSLRLVSSRYLIFPGPAVTVETHTLSPHTQNIALEGRIPIFTSVDLPAGIVTY